MTCRSISVTEASEMVGRDPAPVILDVRTEEEFDGELGHLHGALLIPLQELQSRVGELEDFRGREILIYCRTGRRSLVAAEILQKDGHAPINVEGGIVAWTELDLPGVDYPA